MTIMYDKYNQPINYNDRVDLLLDGAWKELKPHKEYCHFIYAGHHFDYIIHRARTTDSVLKQIEDACNNKQYNIFFDCSEESIGQQNIVVVHNIVKEAINLFPNCRFFFITGEATGKEAYEAMCELWNEKPLLEIVSFYLFESMYNANYIGANNSYTPINRSKKYTCLNRVLRLHRIKLLDRLLSENLVNDDCYYSFCNPQQEDGGLTEILKSLEVQNSISIKNNLDFIRTLKLTFDDRTQLAEIKDQDIHLYTESYFSLVTETIFDDVETYKNCVFLTEKTFKPIMMLQPFIIVANMGTLAALRERGYKTFSPYIDETYDTIEDGEDRILAISNEVKRLCNQTDSEWLEWCTNIKPIVEYNQRHLFNGDRSYFDGLDLISRLHIPV